MYARCEHARLSGYRDSSPTPDVMADTLAASLATPAPKRVGASKGWAKALESAAAGVVREAVCLAFCAFSLAFSVLLSEVEILTLSLNLLLLIRALVVLESTKGAMEKVSVASSEATFLFLPMRCPQTACGS